MADTTGPAVIDTTWQPPPYRTVSTSRTAGWLLLRYAPRQSAVVIATVALLACTGMGRPRFVQVAVQPQAQVIYVPVVYYAVGASVQVEALRAVIAQQEAEIAALRGHASSVSAAEPELPPGDARPQTADTPGLVIQHCAKCHSGENAKAGLSLTGDLPAEQRLGAIARLLDDDEARRMPKGETLEPETLGRIIQELSR